MDLTRSRASLVQELQNSDKASESMLRRAYRELGRRARKGDARSALEAAALLDRVENGADGASPTGMKITGISNYDQKRAFAETRLQDFEAENGLTPGSSGGLEYLRSREDASRRAREGSGSRDILMLPGRTDRLEPSATGSLVDDANDPIVQSADRLVGADIPATRPSLLAPAGAPAPRAPSASRPSLLDGNALGASEGRGDMMRDPSVLDVEAPVAGSVAPSLRAAIAPRSTGPGTIRDERGEVVRIGNQFVPVTTEAGKGMKKINDLEARLNSLSSRFKDSGLTGAHRFDRTREPRTRLVGFDAKGNPVRVADPNPEVSEGSSFDRLYTPEALGKRDRIKKEVQANLETLLARR